MTNLFKIPTWADKEHIHAVVETPRGSTCKLDFDPELKVFTLAKALMALCWLQQGEPGSWARRMKPLQ